MMKLTIKYKNGFIKTILVDGIFIKDGEFVYYKDNTKVSTQYAYIDSFYCKDDRRD